MKKKAYTTPCIEQVEILLEQCMCLTLHSHPQ